MVDFDTAVTMSGGGRGHILARGTARIEMGQHIAAKEDFDALIRADPDDMLALNNRCYALALADRAPEALPDCEKALSMRPDYGPALDSRAFVFLRLGRYQSAIEDYDAALRRMPRSALSLYGRGIARLRNGDPAGNEDIVEAVRINPGVAARMARARVTP